jgi:multidrug efflux pump subunit AcrB
MKLIDHSIRNYHTVTVIMVMLTVVGIICFNTLPRQLIPTVDKPLIEVKTIYRGLSGGTQKEDLQKPEWRKPDHPGV